MSAPRITTHHLLMVLASIVMCARADAETLPRVPVDGQPLAANIARLIDALQFLGAPLSQEVQQPLVEAIRGRDGDRLQEILDQHVLLCVSINPESRVKVQRGPATARLQQAGFVPLLIKVVNHSTVTKQLRIVSPQSGPVYAGTSQLSMQRQQQLELLNDEPRVDADERFLAVSMFQDPPMTRDLSGLEVEYAVALIYSSQAGKREATIGFDVGQGTQDLGFRGETPVLFEIAPAVRVKMEIRDMDGQPTVARLLFRDEAGRVYPPQAKRLAPDFFFQPQIYRADGDELLLPPGKLTMQFSRGPEYVVQQRQVTIPERATARLQVELQRWINPREFGYFSGDHHIHAAGCAHYTIPTQGVEPRDMFRQVKGEGLNVGCVLTWGPCFDYQRQFFSPRPLDISDRSTLLKYDLEISGFGSQALGHVCLLNLKDHEYPGSDGTSHKGWPTWTTPVMRWAKQQGGYAGYAHSASGLQINSRAASERLLQKLDADRDGQLDSREAAMGLLPEPFEHIDADNSRALTLLELAASHERAAESLPNLAIPEMNGVGAMEIGVSVVEGVCDFISAMDTARIQEWNMWYHLLNCGFPLKVSGETDFPCMSSRRVGQGRVYVQLGPAAELNYADWCRGLAQGRSYVSDGFAHPLVFEVNGVSPGQGSIQLNEPATVSVHAKVAFARETPLAVAHGGIVPESGRRVVGDTVLLHGPRSEEMQRGGMRTVELIANGQVVGARQVPVDGQIHDLRFEVTIQRSTWLALRNFPQCHTNPVDVLIGERPIRASRHSALWCAETIRLLWINRNARISQAERPMAEEAFQRAIARFEQIAGECE